MRRSTSRRTCWVLGILGALLAVPVVAGPPTIKKGIDIFSTSAGTQADFTYSPLPADFFCTGSPAFSGSIPLTGVPLTTSPAGIAGITDTIVERLADGVFGSGGTTTIPVIVRALKMRSSSTFSVTCSGVSTDWKADVCLCGTQDETSITAKIDSSCEKCGTFDGALSVKACLTFSRLDNGDVRGPVAQKLKLRISKMPWCYEPGAHETVISDSFLVDPGCGGEPGTRLPGTTNFHPGWSCKTVGLDCLTLFSSLTECHENYDHPGDHLHCVNPVCGKR
jgi:hypothetical protein